MKQIQNTNYETFLENVPKNWEEIFIEEYKEYWELWELKWFYIEEDFVWWAWFWYNPDSFKETKWIEIINNLNSNKYIKISYFFIKEDFRWKYYGKEFLSSIIENNNSYFLTCEWENLKKYYTSLWFEVIYEENDKYILIKN